MKIVVGALKMEDFVPVELLVVQVMQAIRLRAAVTGIGIHVQVRKNFDATLLTFHHR